MDGLCIVSVCVYISTETDEIGIIIAEGKRKIILDFFFKRDAAKPINCNMQIWSTGLQGHIR